MTISKIDSFFANRALTNDINNRRADLTEIQKQISTGKKFRTFEQLSQNGIIENTLGFKVSIERTTKYMEANKVVGTRLDSTVLVLDQLIDLAADAKKLIMEERNPVMGTNIPLKTIMDAKLEDVANNLNMQIESRYLFSGSRTNVAPVTKPLKTQTPNIDFQTLIINDSYYNGDDVDLNLQANDTTEVSYNIRANDSAFQKLIASMFTAIKGEQTSNDDLLKSSFTMITEAIDELNSLRVGVQNNKFAIADINFQHEETKLFLHNTLTELTETDIAEASILFAMGETTLQASFVIFARMSNLKLSDYI